MYIFIKQHCNIKGDLRPFCKKKSSALTPSGYRSRSAEALWRHKRQHRRQHKSLKSLKSTKSLRKQRGTQTLKTSKSVAWVKVFEEV